MRNRREGGFQPQATVKTIDRCRDKIFVILSARFDHAATRRRNDFGHPDGVPSEAHDALIDLTTLLPGPVEILA